MLYRETDSRRSLQRWLASLFGARRPEAARRRRVEIDLRELSPHLQRDLGLDDRGYPF